MKHKKSHKKDKKRKKEKKEKKSKRRASSSSSSSDTEDEIWVEKGTGASVSDTSLKASSVPTALQRDDWMSNPDIFKGLTREEIRGKKSSEDDKKEETAILAKPGQSERELNPYWRDGGTGLPSEEPQGLNTRVGDQGVAWLRKALQRAKEQAEEEGRSLETVAAERWGSLEKLNSMLREAEKKVERRGSNRPYADRECSDDRYRPNRGGSFDRDRRDSRSDRSDRDYNYKRNRFIRPEEENHSSQKYGDRTTTERSRDDSYRQRPNSSRQGWRKKREEEEEVKHERNNSYSPPPRELRDSKVLNKELPSSEERNESSNNIKTPKTSIYEDLNSLNDIGAQIIKAEIMGNMTLAAELRVKLDKARAATDAKKNVVVLTRTDHKGFTHPVKGSTSQEGPGRKNKRKAPTHESGKRVRYFADDDKFSLQDMFEQEKLNTGSDQDEVFARLARKKIGRDDSARDMEDVFEETATIHDEDRQADRERSKAIKEHRVKERVLDNCRWCLDSKMARDCVVTIGKTIYVSVPTCQSLTEGHCLIVPTQHISCVTALDEDVWEEVCNLKKILVNLYLSREEDVIFFESALYLNKYPHMVINCVPVPKEIGDVAPIYFKKAILECEMEWSTNKKLVDLAGKGVRRAVPKGLSYFSVDFGLQDGYAHVIEDQKLFPNNFAQEVIGGMMDLDHSIWRKPKRETDEVLEGKVSEFRKVFQTVDPYKKE